MSKDNRDMSNKNLEDKMVEARHKWRGFFCNDDGSCSDTPDKVYGTGFFDGYELAQKEMQEKLDAAIEVIKKLADHCFEEPDTYFACVFCDMGNSGHSLKGKGYHDDYCLAKRARDFLKAREEK